MRFPRAKVSSKGKWIGFSKTGTALSNGYPFAKVANHLSGNGYVPGSQLRLYTDCHFPKSITQFAEP